jgi:lipoprotein-anchoring transpeptidase ErfK/SrfK
MEVMHYSQEWDNAGMPHSIFFTSRGHAVHGSNHPGLGTPVSHGCVRLTLTNAATLYQLVGARGMGETTVIVKGSDPAGQFAPSKAPQPRPKGFFPFGGLFGGSR